MAEMGFFTRSPGSSAQSGSGTVLHRVALVRNLNALRKKALAALLAAAAENVTAGFGRHAGTESELAAAGALGRLIGAEAHGCGRAR